MEENKSILRQWILSAITNRSGKELKEIFETIPNIDIAEAINDVEDPKTLLYIFRVVGSEYSADFFAELTPEQQEIVIGAFSDKELIELISDSYADDIVDAIEEMPANIVSRVLKACPKDLRGDVNRLLNYKENTAGSIMTTEYIEMKDSVTVKDAINEIRTKGKDAETVYTIFVRDSRRTLVGTVEL